MNRAVIVLLVLLAAGWAMAGDCPYEVGQWGYGPIAAIDVKDGLGLVASGAVLQVVDLSRPTTLDVLGELTLPAVIEALALAGGHQAVAVAGEHELWLVDLTDPEELTGTRIQLGRDAGPLTLVAASGPRVFAVNQIDDDHPSFRLTILDVSTPMAPLIAGSYSRGGLVQDVAAEGDMVYLAVKEENTLLGLDVSDPQNPGVTVFPGEHYAPQGAIRVTVAGDEVYFSESFQPGCIAGAALHALTADSLVPKWKESLNLRNVTDIESDGESILFASSYGLATLDLTDPDRSLTGSYGDMYEIRDLEIGSGGIAYLVFDRGGFRTLDISDPTEPYDIGALGLTGWYPMYGMTLAGDILIGASPGDGLTLVDVADPSRPRLVSANPELGIGGEVVSSGDHAFVSHYGGGVEIIDISQPESPTAVNTIVSGEPTFGLALDWPHLFVSSDVLEVYDVSNPIEPIPVATFDVAGRPYLVGDRLFLGASDGLRIVDVSDPTAPAVIGWVATDWQVADSHVTAMTSTDELVFVGSWASNPWSGFIHVIDITNPGAPWLRTFVDVGDPVIGLVEDRGFLTAGVGWWRGLLTYDVTNADHPWLVSSLEPLIPRAYGHDEPMDVVNFMGAGPLAIAGLLNEDYDAPALRFVDMTDPARPVFAGTLPRNVKTTGVTMHAGFAITTGADMRVMDLEDPDAPTSAAALDVSVYADQIAVVEHVAYVAGYNDGLRIIDLSEPTRPVEIEGVRMVCRAVAADGDRLYVVGRWGPDILLKTYDISDPGHPIEIGSYKPLHLFERLAVRGNIAVGLSSHTRVSVMDVSDPAAPEEIGYAYGDGYPTSVTISDQMVYFTTSTRYDGSPTEGYGLFIIDISDPSNPVEAASVLTPGDAQDVFLAGDLAYISDGDNGVLVYDIIDPYSPVFVRRIMTPGSAKAAALKGRMLVVADGDGGLNTITFGNCRIEDPDRASSAVD